MGIDLVIFEFSEAVIDHSTTGSVKIKQLINQITKNSFIIFPPIFSQVTD